MRMDYSCLHQEFVRLPRFPVDEFTGTRVHRLNGHIDFSCGKGDLLTPVRPSGSVIFTPRYRR
jgi:hypothetical protein